MKKIQILGTGCPKCEKLAGLAEGAARELGIDYELEKVTEIGRIVELGVLATPALVVDGVVVASGRLPSEDEIKRMLQ